MRVVVIDDERIPLNMLMNILEKIPEVQSIKGFGSPKEALLYITENPVDVIFSDIEMFEMTGLELAEKVKAIFPCIQFIFVSGYSEYALEAMKVHANGYLLKPIVLEDVKKELNFVMSQCKKVQLVIKTFGNFEVIVNNKPLHFKRSKSKELLAYLIDRRGTSTSLGELLGILWEDKPIDNNAKSLLRHVVYDLKKTLESAGFSSVLIKQRNSLAVNTSLVECDYYQFLDGDERVKRNYFGEYMVNYSWAEYTNALLNKMILQIEEKGFTNV